MQFSCDKCHTRYNVNDDKIRGKTVRVQCKKCGNPIIVRDQTPVEEVLSHDDDSTHVVRSADVKRDIARQKVAPKSTDPGPAAPSPTVEVAPALVLPSQPATVPAPWEPEPPAPAAAPVPSWEPEPPAPAAAPAPSWEPERPVPTGLAPPSDDAWAPAPDPAPVLPPPLPPPPVQDKVEWFVGINGTEVGPLSRASIRERVRVGEVTTRSYVWREGMAGWSRVEEVEALADVMPQRPPPLPRDEPSYEGAQKATPVLPVESPAAPSPAPLPTPAAPAAPEPPPAPAPALASSVPPDARSAKRLGEKGLGGELSTIKVASNDITRRIDMRREPIQPPKPSLTPLEMTPHVRAPPKPADRRQKRSSALPVLLILFLVAGGAIAYVWVRYPTVRLLLPFYSDDARGRPATVDTHAIKAPPPAVPAKPAPAVQPPASAATVAMAPAGPTGKPFDTSAVPTRLASIHSQLESCVTQAVKREPSLKIGKLKIATTIEPSGAIGAIGFSHESVRETELGRCLQKSVRAMHFDPFAGAAQPLEIPLNVGVEP